MTIHEQDKQGYKALTVAPLSCYLGLLED